MPELMAGLINSQGQKYYDNIHRYACFAVPVGLVIGCLWKSEHGYKAITALLLIAEGTSERVHFPTGSSTRRSASLAILSRQGHRYQKAAGGLQHSLVSVGEV